MPKLNNPTANAVTGHHAGTPYTIPAKGSLIVESQDAAAKLVVDLAVHGVTMTPDAPPKKGKE